MRRVKRILAGILAAAVAAGTTVLPAFAEGERASVHPKINCQAVGATTEASSAGSDGTSNSDSVIDNVKDQTGGNYKWYIAGNKLTGANLTIILPQKYKIDKIILFSGYTARDPATENTEENKPLHKTAEIPFKYQFEYANASGEFEMISGTKVDKAFDGLTTADREVTFEFDEIETNKIKFAALDGNYDFRLREIELYGVETESDTPPAPTVENVALHRPAIVSAKSNGTSEALTDGTTNQTTGDNVWVASESQAAAGAYADIDLGLADISSMVLHHGMNSGIDKLTDFEIQYLGETGTEYRTLKTVTGVDVNPYTVTFDETVRAKHIRIVSKCSAMFRIREIEVYGTKVSGGEPEKQDPTIAVETVTDAAAGSNVTLNAVVTANDNTINQVEFYNGSVKLGDGTENGGKYEYALQNAAGSYNITAKLTYNTDQTITSAPMIFTAGYADMGTNVAEGKTASASYYSSANGGPSVLTDKAKETPTGPYVVFVDQNKTMGVKFDIDLGNLCDVDKVMLYHGMNNPRTQTLHSFDLQYSAKAGTVTDDDYVTVKTVTGATVNPWLVVLDSPVRAGHIRLVSNVENSSSNMFRLLEIEVYGTEILPSPTVTVDSINDAIVGNPVTLSASVTDNGNTIDKVEFYDGASLLGAGTLNGGKYVYTFANAALGSHSITAKVTYDTDKTVTSEPQAFTVQAPPEPDAPLVTVDPIADIAEGDPITLSAAVTDNGNTITAVEFLDGAESLGSGALTDGKYAFAWTNPSVGTHRITAKVSYGTDKSVTSAAVSFTVKAKPTAAVDAVGDVTAGESVTLRAVVTDNGNTIEKVEFFDGSDLLGEGTQSGGKYEYTVDEVALGSHSIIVKVTYDTDKTVTSAAVAFTAAEAVAQPVNLASKQNVIYGVKDQGADTALTDGVTTATSGGDVWFVGKDKTMGAWVDIPLIKRGRVQSVKVYSGYNDTNPATKDKLTDFEIWYSDSENPDTSALTDYTLAKSVSNAPLGLVDVQLDVPVTAQHIKIVSKVENNRTDAQNSGGIRVREIEVYGFEVDETAPNIEIGTVTGALEGDDILLSAVVTANGNEITSVEFLDNDVLLGAGILNNGKYEYTLSGVAKGAHSITVRLTYGGTQTMSFGPMRFTAEEREGYFGITIVSPTEETVVSIGQLLRISAEVSDRQQKLKEVALLFNGKVVKTFTPVSDGKYETDVRARGGVNTVEVRATASDGSVQSKSIEVTGRYGKISYDKTFTAEGSVKGSDSGSTPDALIDGKSNGDTGSNKWYINSTVSADSWASITFPGEYRITQIVLTSGYVSRNPAVVNVEANRPDNTAEIPFHYQFEYRNEEGEWTAVPGAVFDKPFNGLSEEDKTVTFTFDEITTTGIRFVCLQKGFGYPYRLREIELYGAMANKPPVIVLTEPANGGMVLEGAGLELLANIQDEDGDIRDVTLYVDGVQTAAEIKQDGTSFTVIMPSAGLAKGTHSVYLTAADSYGETGTSDTVSITVVDEAAILKVLENSTRADIADNLEYTAKQLGIDLSGFHALSKTKQEKILLDMLNREFPSKSSLQSYLNNAVADANKGDSGSGPSGGGTSNGGGGGSAGAGSAGVITPVPDGSKPNVNPQPDNQEVFVDLDEADWAREAILTLAADGVINGVGDRVFAPLDFVTRGQFAKMLIGAFGLEQSGAAASFADVAQDHMFYPYIASAQSLGIVKGREDGTFGVDERITREDLAVMMQRAAAAAQISLPQSTEAEQFADAVSISVYAAEAVGQLQQAGIMNGMGDGRFAPQENANRAMAAKVICELMKIRQEG